MNETDKVPSYSQIPDSNISCVPAFTTCFNQATINEVEKPSPGTDPGGNGQWKKEKTFPWLASFLKQCYAAVGNKSVKQLENLLNLYIQHVTAHFNEWHKLPNKAAKLKRNINETMVFLHLLYSDLHEPLENSFYHEKMSEIMAMFIDLEITASRRGKDTIKEVSNRLSSTLCTFLDHSEDHILDAILKTQLINKHSKNVCAPFLRKVLTELVVCRPLSALTYVRFVLACKLWKNVVADATHKKAINKIALQRLHPPPKFFQNHDVAKPSCEVLPKVPKNKKNFTQFYIQTKFNVKDACRAFFRFCKENNYRDEPIYISQFSMKNEEVESSGCLNLINDIWSTIANDASDDMPLLGKSEVFSEDRIFCDDSSLCEAVEDPYASEKASKGKAKVESPDSGVCLDGKGKRKPKSKDGESDKIPDSTYAMYPDSQEAKSCGDESTDAEGSVVEIIISETSSPEPSSTVSASNDSSALSRLADDPPEEAADSSRLTGPAPPASLAPVVSSAPALMPSELPRSDGTHDAHKISAAASSFVIRLPKPTAASQEIEFHEGSDLGKIKTEMGAGSASAGARVGAGAAAGAGAAELPSSSRLETKDGAQSSCTVSPERELLPLSALRTTETYDEIALEGGDLSEDEWRRYSEYLSHATPSAKDEIWKALEDIHGSHTYRPASNCHLPLKKRKLAASSSSSTSPPVEPKLGYQHSVALSEEAFKKEPSNYQYQGNLFSPVVGNSSLEFVLEAEDTYKVVHWNSALESRKRPVDARLESERQGLAAGGFPSETNAGRAPNAVEYALPKVHPQGKSPCVVADVRSASGNSLEQSSKRDLFAAHNLNASATLQSVVSKLEMARGSTNASEEPDNLKILAEEAVRIWEAEQGATVAQNRLRGPFGVFATPPQATVKKEMRQTDYFLSYPTSPMISIAEALESSSRKKCVEDSVIVRNDQYQYYSEVKGRVGVYPHTSGQVKVRDSGRSPSSEYKCKVEDGDSQHRLNGNQMHVVARVETTTKLPHQTRVQPERGQSASNASNKNAAHGHAPHGHASHGHASHGHAPHGHAPHGHAPHGHAPHGHASHGHAPRGQATTNGCDLREHKPLDMSAGRRKNNLPYSQSVHDKPHSSCSNCKSAACKGKCRVSANSVQGTVSRQQATSDKMKCSNCRGEGCNGKKCNRAVPQASHDVTARRALVSPPNSNSESQRRSKKCPTCKNLNCDGKCPSASTKSHANHSNKVLRCERCKLANCNGSCNVDSNRQTNALVNVHRPNAADKVPCQYCRKQGCDSSQCTKKLAAESVSKCAVCKNGSCKGKCKASPNHKTSVQVVHINTSPVKTPKCVYCKSICMGTCRLAQKNQLLERMKCSHCNGLGCRGRCLCSYCSQKNCNGACRIHHSVDSILSSSSTARPEPESSSSRSVKRRTRNSQPLPASKSQNIVPEEKSSLSESKRRKKSVSR